MADRVHQAKVHTMNETILNYPGFWDLPKSIRQLLVKSEEYFFHGFQPRAALDSERSVILSANPSGSFRQPHSLVELERDAGLAMQNLIRNFSRKKSVAGERLNSSSIT